MYYTQMAAVKNYWRKMKDLLQTVFPPVVAVAAVTKYLPQKWFPTICVFAAGALTAFGIMRQS